MTTAVLEPRDSLLIGVRAARANLVPGLIVQSLMLALMVGYYFSEGVHGLLNEVGAFKAGHRVLFSVGSAILAGAVGPEVLKILCFQRGRPNRQNLHLMLYTTVLWGVTGIVIDGLYWFQGVMFGDGHSFAVIAPKVLVDQFVYNPVLGAPMNTIAYDMAARGLTWEHLAGCFSWGYYRDKIVPCLLATWGVWIPVVCFIYALPADLQIPLFALALTFWALMLAYMSRKRG